MNKNKEMKNGKRKKAFPTYSKASPLHRGMGELDTNLTYRKWIFKAEYNDAGA